MSKLEELLKQEKFELGIQTIVSVLKVTSRVTKMMNPIFIACNEREQTITIEFPVLEEQLNEHETMHAGFIATAFDEALGIFAAYLGNGNPTVSINISLNYLKPIPKNDSIHIIAKVTSLGRKIITVSGECYLKSNGLLTNTALITFAVIE